MLNSICNSESVLVHVFASFYINTKKLINSLQETFPISTGCFPKIPLIAFNFRGYINFCGYAKNLSPIRVPTLKYIWKPGGYTNKILETMVRFEKENVHAWVYFLKLLTKVDQSC